MVRTKITDNEIQEIMGEDYFYEYGMDPSLKKLATIVQNNTYDYKSPRRTTIITHPTRYWKFRDMNDLIQYSFGIDTLPKSALLQVVSLIVFSQTLEYFTKFLPIGQYGIRTYQQTNLFKVYGRLGVFSACLLPIFGVYQLYHVSKVNINMFWDRAILQNRNWALEYSNNKDAFNQTYSYLNETSRVFSSDKAIEVFKQNTLEFPDWFKDEEKF